MTVPAGTDAVTDAPIADAQANAAADADKHTKDSAIPTPEAPPASSPADATGDNGLAALREQVGTLGQTVDTLSKAVSELVGNAHPDESTQSKLPFLLRGKRVEE